MDNEAREDFLSIDAKRLFKELVHNWITVAAIFLVCIVAFSVYGLFLSSPQYTSSATIYAVNQDKSTISTSEFAISSYLTKDCCELIVSRTVLEDVIRELELDTTYESLKSKIKVSNSEETRFITVKVTTEEPEKSRKIANSICEVSKEKIVDYLGVDWVKITDNANLPKAPSGPSLKSYLIYGFAVALLLSAAFILFMYYRNDKINNAEDVEKYLGLCTLATIPYNRNKAIKNSNNARSR